MSWDVHIDWQGESHLVGRLRVAQHGPAVTFEYAVQWLARTELLRLTLLPYRSGQVRNTAAHFRRHAGLWSDRWGRLLIERAVRKKVLAQKPYGEIDYVVALDDSSRLGALRFRGDEKSPFLAPTIGKLPPFVRLQALLRATDAVHSDAETATDLKFLLGAGSPLGGARPKSAVGLPDGRIALAKFPKPDDTRDIAAGEILALTLGAEAGIRVVEHKLVAADLRELWRRLVFSLLASNYDDHLRNHGFLMHEPGRWSLSPAYDINPVPELDRARVNKMPISEENEEPSIDRALAVAPRFGIKAPEANKILSEVFAAISPWRKIGRKLGLKASTLDAYPSAFENGLLDEAQRLLRS